MASDFDKTWIESFKNYAVDIGRIYKNNPGEILNCLKFDSVLGSLNETYQALVKDGDIKPVEGLEVSVKRQLWEQSKQYGEGSDSRCILICKVIYLLNEITQ
jgi:hypothetical protein